MHMPAGFTVFIIILSLQFLPARLSSQKYDRHADSLLKALSNSTADTTRLRLHLEMAKYFSNTDARITLTHAREAEKLSEQLKREKELAEAINLAGIGYFYAGMVEESARYYTRYLEMKKSKGSDFDMAVAYSSLAGIWMMKTDYDRADSLYSRALKLLENIRDEKILSAAEKTKSLAVLYNNLSIVYREKNQLDLAASYNEKGIALCASVPELKKEWIRLINNYADILAKKGRSEEAVLLLESALDSARNLSDIAMQFATHYSLAKVYQMKGASAKALENAYKSLGLVIPLKDPQSIHTITNLMYNIYKVKGPSDSALKYLSISQQHDSLIRLEQAKDLLLKQELKDALNEQELQSQEKHRTTLIYWGAAALLFFASAVFLLIKYYNNRKKLQMTHLESLRIQLDAEKLALEKELLANQLEDKDKQIATNVMYQLQKNELIQGVTKKLLLFAREKKTDADETIHAVIKELEKATDQNIWEEFEIRFQEVHRSFYDKLQQQFPDLSPNERRLCAFLRLNMSSKEISTITGQSIHSIQVARTRLRKKMNLTHTEQGLIEYLANI